MVQVVEHLHSNCKTLSSNLGLPKKKTKRKRKREKKSQLKISPKDRTKLKTKYQGLKPRHMN
jgi:hypothetical protein